MSLMEGQKWSQVVVSVIAAISLFIAGLHTGWPTPSLEQLFLNESPFPVSQQQASGIKMMGNVGNFCGSFAGYIYLNKIGRHLLTTLIAVPQFISFIFIILSYEVMELLYVARILGGIGEGMSVTIIYSYIGEIAEPSIRGALCTLASFSLYFGHLAANTIGSFLNIRNTAFTFIAFPVIFLILFWKMPETPYFLLMKNKEDKAIEVLQFLRRKEDVREELEKLKKDVARQMSERGSFIDIFIVGSNRRAFIVTIGARFFQLGSGMSTLSYYLQVRLKQSADALEPYIGSTFILVLQIIMTLLSAVTVDRWGRKPLLLFSITGCFFNLILLTIFFTIEEHSNIDVSVVNWIPLMLMIFYIILYSLGLGVIVNVLTGEMFSTSIKAKLLSLVNALYALGALSLSFTEFYQAIAHILGRTGLFSTFAVLSFFGILFFKFVVPETKHKTLEEIQQQLKGNKSKNQQEEDINL